MKGFAGKSSAEPGDDCKELDWNDSVDLRCWPHQWQESSCQRRSFAESPRPCKWHDRGSHATTHVVLATARNPRTNQSELGLAAPSFMPIAAQVASTDVNWRSLQRSNARKPFKTLTLECPETLHRRKSLLAPDYLRSWLERVPCLHRQAIHKTLKPSPPNSGNLYQLQVKVSEMLTLTAGANRALAPTMPLSSYILEESGASSLGARLIPPSCEGRHPLILADELSRQGESCSEVYSKTRLKPGIYRAPSSN